MVSEIQLKRLFDRYGNLTEAGYIVEDDFRNSVEEVIKENINRIDIRDIGSLMHQIVEEELQKLMEVR